MNLRHVIFTLSLACCCTVLVAQPPAGLTRDGDTFRHEASKSSLKVSKDWEVVDTKGTVRQPHVALHKAFAGTDVMVTWSKLQDIKFDEAVELELNQLIQSYGKDKVVKKEPITIDNKSVSVIELTEGPDRNGKQVGVIYLFDAGPDAKDRWKVKMRAIVSKSSQNEGMKAVSELLKQFQW
ncbi:MAG TPA: hypothetical protein PLN21_06945 [Gemmatales bacterium]|nr:hypothetical protein [Gemmatales bacterium]